MEMFATSCIKFANPWLGDEYPDTKSYGWTNIVNQSLFSAHQSLLNADNHACFGLVALLSDHKFRPNAADRGASGLIKDNSLLTLP